MNCPSRTDEVDGHPEWNQNPGALSSDLTTRQDLNGMANLRTSRNHLPPESATLEQTCEQDTEHDGYDEPRKTRKPRRAGLDKTHVMLQSVSHGLTQRLRNACPCLHWPSVASRSSSSPFVRGVLTLASFVGPGFLVAVAYIDPGNYATDVSAGAETKFRLLFIVLMSNIFAVVLQSLSIRLGTVTGKSLSEHCRAHLPMWLNILIYILAEAAIIATDIAEVGSNAFLGIGSCSVLY